MEIEGNPQILDTQGTSHYLKQRVKTLHEECDRAIKNMENLQIKTRNLPQSLNCESPDWVDQLSTCLKTLDECNFFMADFNNAYDSLEINEVPIANEDTALNSIEDKSTQCGDAEDGTSEIDSVPATKQDVLTPDPIEAAECGNDSEVTTEASLPPIENIDLVGPKSLVIGTTHAGVITHVDIPSLWVIVDDFDGLMKMQNEVNKYYSDNVVTINYEQLSQLSCCAFYYERTRNWYRCFIINTNKKNKTVNIRMVDSGEVLNAPVTNNIQPLVRQFCLIPPFVQRSHFANLDFPKMNKERMQSINKYMAQFTYCDAKFYISHSIVRNSVESHGVVVTLSEGTILNEMMVFRGIAVRTKNTANQGHSVIKPERSGQNNQNKR